MKRQIKNTPKGFKNREMNESTYALRRNVMSEVYAAKSLLLEHNVRLPRIEVRISDDVGRNALGIARMSTNCIWIAAEVIEKNMNLKFVVFHEILHAVWAIPHISTCKLMNAMYRNIDSSLIEKLFVAHAVKATKKNKRKKDVQCTVAAMSKTVTPNLGLISQVEELMSEAGKDLQIKLVGLRAKLYHQTDLTDSDYVYMSAMGIVL